MQVRFQCASLCKIVRTTHSLLIVREGQFCYIYNNISYFFILRNVLDQFLKELIVSGLADSAESMDTDNKCNNLTVQQVKVVDTQGNLKLVYPSRADLNFSEQLVVVLRE